MTVTWGFGLTSRFEALSDDERAALCLAFVEEGYAPEVVELIGDRMASITRSGVSWLDDRKAKTLVRKWLSLDGGAAPRELLSRLGLTADLYVGVKRKASERVIELPGTVLDGMTVAVGGDAVINAIHPARSGPDPDLKALADSVAPFFGINRARRFVVSFH